MNWVAPTQALEWQKLLPGAGAIAALVYTVLRRQEPDVHKRGAQVLRGRQAARAIRRRRRGSETLLLAGVPLFACEETRHFKLIGATGTGKSSAIAGLMAGALARGDRAVITDPDSGYRTRFFDRRRGDIVLNPFEPCSVKWDPFAEIREPWDVEQLASGLIPTSEDASGREWRGYARTFLSAVIRRCANSGCRDAGELWRFVTVA
ncbi:MAG: type IV secretion system DNA-binding domain-containing protein, partial [Gammaproteobacteria bacterium]|nr:type IV secretion system DNA-binding domain-containing protein [Gammaproteobacteria bacterium]